MSEDNSEALESTGENVDTTSASDTTNSPAPTEAAPSFTKKLQKAFKNLPGNLGKKSGEAYKKRQNRTQKTDPMEENAEKFQDLLYLLMSLLLGKTSPLGKALGKIFEMGMIGGNNAMIWFGRIRDDDKPKLTDGKKSSNSDTEVAQDIQKERFNGDDGVEMTEKADSKKSTPVLSSVKDSNQVELSSLPSKGKDDAIGAGHNEDKDEDDDDQLQEGNDTSSNMTNS